MQERNSAHAFIYKSPCLKIELPRSSCLAIAVVPTYTIPLTALTSLICPAKTPIMKEWEEEDVCAELKHAQPFPFLTKRPTQEENRNKSPFGPIVVVVHVFHVGATLPSCLGYVTSTSLIWMSSVGIAGGGEGDGGHFFLLPLDQGQCEKLGGAFFGTMLLLEHWRNIWRLEFRRKMPNPKCVYLFFFFEACEGWMDPSLHLSLEEKIVYAHPDTKVRRLMTRGHWAMPRKRFKTYP